MILPRFGHTVGVLVGGDRRACAPSKTWARLDDVTRARIARLGDLSPFEPSGLRSIVRAVRPGAADFSVNVAAGIDEVAARVAAVAGAIERADAERIDRAVTLGSAESLGGRAVDPALWPRRRGARWSSARIIPWSSADDLLGGHPLLVPFELVHARAALPEVPGTGCFLGHPTGLAAGNTSLEAVVYGLLEVIERDAEMIHAHGVERWTEQRAQVPEGFSATLDTLRAAGERVRVWNTTTNLGVPAVRVWLGGGPAWAGAAARCSPQAALEAALGEALAARAEHQAGGPWSPIRRRTRTISVERCAMLDQLQDDTPGCSLDALASLPDGTLELILDAILGQLRTAGLPHALWLPLSEPDAPLAVVRTLIPGLEPPRESADYVRGPRVGGESRA